MGIGLGMQKKDSPMTIVQRSLILKKIKAYRVLYLFLLPAIVITFLFAYLPMFGNVIAFMDYDITNGWMGLKSPFVGFKWFHKVFTDANFYKLVFRTLYYSLFTLVVNIPAPLIFAILLNEVRNRFFKRTVQTISYLPHFISWVTMASLVYLFLSTDSSGIVNIIREKVFGLEKVIFMKDASNFPFVMALSSMFKETGWGAIIYLAAISALSPQLYEAARIDGAGRWKQLWYITLPGIMQTTVILVILSLGNLLSTNFDMVFNLQNDIIRYDTNTINVYTYYAGVKGAQYSISTAIGLFNGAVNCIMLLLADFLSKKVTKYGLF